MCLTSLKQDFRVGSAVRFIVLRRQRNSCFSCIFYNENSQISFVLLNVVVCYCSGRQGFKTFRSVIISGFRFCRNGGSMGMASVVRLLGGTGFCVLLQVSLLSRTCICRCYFGSVWNLRRFQ